MRCEAVGNTDIDDTGGKYVHVEETRKKKSCCFSRRNSGDGGGLCSGVFVLTFRPIMREQNADLAKKCNDESDVGT